MNNNWWIHVLVAAIASVLIVGFIKVAGAQGADILISIVLIIIGILFHFIPSIIAVHRNHKNKVGILLLNFFLGWTLFGWVGSLIWAVLQDADREKEKNGIRNVHESDEKECPYCAEKIKNKAKVCRFCNNSLS
ncbi:superinfection immunity protein [Halomonas alkaliantarctica]|uniref:superinfection immunity protein n=1 Tax=Halomonas alkaliantarctica TaxID=232346 RepID=UPI00055478C6|nr:superinfection immunity protein [Halomonas alkaliantarctica]